MPSVVSVAEIVTVSGVSSVTVNSATPLLTLVTPLVVAMVAWLPPLAAIVTVLPLMSLPFASVSCTLTNACVVPSAAIPPSGGVSSSGVAKAPTSEVARAHRSGVLTAQVQRSTPKFGDPSPTWAKSLPIDAAV